MAAPTLNEEIRRLTASSGKYITESQVRASIDDNLGHCGALDPGYRVSVTQIASAMVNAAAEVNGMEPSVVKINPSFLPNFGWMLDGVLGHLYRILLSIEQDLDVGTAGTNGDSVAARRVQHFTTNVARFLSSAREGALRWKQQVNRNQGWGVIG